MTGEARDLFARFIADGDVGAFAEDLPKLLAKSFSSTMQTLRDKDFQRLLEDYPRGQRTFIVAPAVMDTVGSEWLIRGADGKQYKPDDYITVFFDFVRDNAAAIDALAILLSRPNDWNPDALLALRDALKGAPQHFTEQNLERAFRARYHKALVDIISMVKHATTDTTPLLTAAERVDAAVAKVVDGRELTEAQSAWIDRIRLHLIENLSIDRDDFSLIPALSDHGGWGSADRSFDGELAELLADVNRELATV